MIWKVLIYKGAQSYQRTGQGPTKLQVSAPTRTPGTICVQWPTECHTGRDKWSYIAGRGKANFTQRKQGGIQMKARGFSEVLPDTPFPQCGCENTPAAAPVRKGDDDQCSRPPGMKTWVTLLGKPSRPTKVIIKDLRNSEWIL